MQRWYRYILQIMLGLCSCMPIMAMNIPVLTEQLIEELMIDLQFNNIQRITYLLDNALISVHSKNKFKVTPLHLAAWYGNVPAIELFLSRNALINSKNNRKSTPLHEAAAQGWFNAVLVLLNNNANIDSKDNGKHTPLHWAAYHGKVEAMALLLDRGAHIESKTNDGLTPLHYAAYNGKVEAMALLLDRGAHIESKCNSEATPISMALNKLNSENITKKEQGQKIIDLIIRSKLYYINMSQMPSTLLGTVIMHLLKKSKERNNQHRYDYIYTAQQVATLLPDERARELLNILRIASTLKDQEQSAKRYLKQYIERQDSQTASELAAIPLRKEGLREITGYTQGLKDVIYLRK